MPKPVQGSSFTSSPSQNQEKKQIDSPLGQQIQQNGEAIKSGQEIGLPTNFQHRIHMTPGQVPSQDNEIGLPFNVKHTYKGTLVPLSSSSSSSSSESSSPEKAALRDSKGKEEENSPSMDDLEASRLKFWALPKGSERKEGLRTVHTRLLNKVRSEGPNMSISDLKKAHSIFSHMDNIQKEGLHTVHAALLKKVKCQGAYMSLEELKEAEDLFKAMPTAGNKEENAKAIYLALKTKVFHLAIDRYNVLIKDGHWNKHNTGPFRVAGTISADQHAQTIRGLNTKTIRSVLTQDNQFIMSKSDQKNEEGKFITNLIKNPAFHDLISLSFENIDEVRSLYESDTQETIKGLAKKIDPNGPFYELQKAFFMALHQTAKSSDQHKMDATNLANVSAGPMIFQELKAKESAQFAQLPKNQMSKKRGELELQVSTYHPLAAILIENAPEIFAELDQKK